MNGLNPLAPGLIVSCQAPEGSPLRKPIVMAAMAEAAQQAGAVGIRAQGTEDIAAIMDVCSLPIIGIIKRSVPGSDVYITPCVSDARELATCGASVVALDMTGRDRPGGEDVLSIINVLHDHSIAVMADVASVAQGVVAAQQGADLVGTTFAPHLRADDGGISPDLSILEGLVRELPGVPIIAEGGYSRPVHLSAALDLGAHAVVVGRAITDTLALATDYVAAARRARPLM